MTTSDIPTSPARHHVVIIGSGFGGLFAAQRLKRADVDIPLIARTTPKPDKLDASWQALQARARALLGSGSG